MDSIILDQNTVSGFDSNNSLVTESLCDDKRLLTSLKTSGINSLVRRSTRKEIESGNNFYHTKQIV